MRVAFSSVVKGVGVFAGQPYHCAVTMFKGDVLVSPCFGTKHYVNASTPPSGCTTVWSKPNAHHGPRPPHPAPDVPYCMNCPPGGNTLLYDHCKRYPELVDVDLLLKYAREQSKAGTIDALGNLSGTNVYLYRGTKDSCYLKGSVQHSQTFFEALGAKVLFNNTTPSAHSWPTKSYGPPCGSGVIESCDYDGPGAALQHIYDNKLKPPVEANPELLMEYDQTPFWTEDNYGNKTFNETMPHVTGFAPAGNIYVPTACKAAGAKCKMHFSLHGCGEESYYDEAVHHLGFQDWGEANNIVIVFPRVIAHGGTSESLGGCWDGYAQSGVDYSLKSGAQMHGMRQMIAAISGV